ncbi:unnamed protein product, partial [Adineta steineri]
MGNFLIVPSFHRKPKRSETNDEQTTTIENKDYHIYYNATPETESSLWIAIKNRRTHSTKSNRIRTTRYNILTFIPKNLFEQFHRIANIYFAILIGLNWVPVINAISKTVAFIPLTVILIITAVKDLVEDLKRWRSDVNINKQKAEVYDKTLQTFIECQWQDLSVGDIIRVRIDQTVPADILLLSSVSSEHTCYLDTAAIDGETNLKQKSIPSCFFNSIKPEEMNFELQCDPPNDDIYHFHGRIVLSSGTNIYSCDNNNILLRGCVLRITDYIDGIIIYAGNQTKIIKSSKTSSSKHALIERYINRDVLFSSLILIFLCLLGAGLSLRWEHSFGNQWRFVTFLIDNPSIDAASHFFASALRFMILFQVLVPIALYVSLDIVRVLQMYTIARDKNLKYEHPISCRTFTINEDLGQIGYIFSDKTDMKLTTEQHSLGFAEQGYRSLLVAYRQIPLEEYENWFEQYRFAANSLDKREDAISDVATQIEVNLMLSGLTAVEDKLQEGVPRTIATLRCAGIKIWLLTGDKQATALSTAQAASLVNIPQTINSDNTPSMLTWEFDVTTHTHMIYYSSQLIEMDQQLGHRDRRISNEIRTSETIARMSEVIAAQTHPVCLVVTGDDLGIILQYKPKEFIRAAAQCQSVLFCRVSATQKRELVTIAKSVFKHRILAIGDGANDVGMIRESHCGIAVFGREGSQAVAAGDFAVDRFECLRYLLLVHGAWCFTRTSELILYTFMHNCQYVLVIFYHQIFNGYSGEVSIHSFYIILYTSLFTVLPQCAAALFDQHVPAERALREPQLYQYTLHGKSYTMSS